MRSIFESTLSKSVVLSAPAAFDPAGSTICDFTGLGVEDLYIAEYCLEKQNRSVTA